MRRYAANPVLAAMAARRAVDLYDEPAAVIRVLGAQIGR